MRMACKPDFVRILRPLTTIHLGLLLPANSCSQPGSLGGRTRRKRRATPIWLCSWRGLPCPQCYHRGGGLLPHLFSLTWRFRRFILCGAFPRVTPAGN